MLFEVWGSRFISGSPSGCADSVPSDCAVLTVIVVLHEMTSFRPIGYSHILDGAAGKYAFLSKKRKKLLTNTRAAGKLNQQNKEG